MNYTEAGRSLVLLASNMYRTYSLQFTTMLYHQNLNLALIFGSIIFQHISGAARIEKSADENSRDSGTYIIQFEDSATDVQLRHFAEQVNRKSNERAKHFEAKIIAEYPSLKFITARLSDRALKWVRMIKQLH